jgi:hypothetical protein
MELSPSRQFLVLDFDELTLSHSLKTEEKLSHVISHWKSNTRLSPIWQAKNTDDESLDSALLENSDLFFIGPAAPHLLEEALGSITSNSCKIWLTLGTKNIVINTSDNTMSDTVQTWLECNSIQYELWKITDKHIISEFYYSLNPSDKNPIIPDTLPELLEIAVCSEIKLALEEFCPLMASTLTRAHSSYPELSEPLLKTLSQVKELVESDTLTELELHSVLLTLNAGLSRLSSQAFSGSSPIIGTECHFWTHSLLGTGVANRALISVVDFVSKILGAALIPDKIENLKNIEDDIPNFFDALETQFWEEKELDKSEIEKDSDITPNIIFFSGRDGFKAQESNVSAPLSSISSCNSYKWSLLPTTHEISHLIVRPVLAHIFPDDHTDFTFDDAKAILSPGRDYKHKNLLSAIRDWLLVSILGLTDPNGDDLVANNFSFEADSIFTNLSEQRAEVEELMVHVFDYLYFYENKDDYISSIWHTWSVIPNIRDRIPGYVVRSLCAIIARGNSGDDKTAFNYLIEKLRQLLTQNSQLQYVDHAIDYMESNENKILSKLMARKPFVNFVVKYLHSNKLERELHRETRKSSSGRNKTSYEKRSMIIDHHTFDNPLLFADSFSRNSHPCEAASFWLLTNLAFNIRSQ